MNKLKVARYRFYFRVTEPLKLPDYSGSALRGVFGHALIQVCGLDIRDIKNRSTAYQYSPYAAVFEPFDTPNSTSIKLDDSPVPYVIEAPSDGKRLYQKGQELTFQMVLINGALDHLATIILAWRRALLNGLGSGKAELISVQQCLPAVGEISIYSEERPIVVPHTAELDIPFFDCDQDINLEFLTMLRLQHKGNILNHDKISAAVLLRSLIRRFSLYFPILDIDEVNRLNALADSITCEIDMQTTHWKRYSGRQKKAMTFTGVIGEWHLKNVAKELIPFIWLGQYLHVGKNTSFGLGGYLLKN